MPESKNRRKQKRKAAPRPTAQTNPERSPPGFVRQALASWSSRLIAFVAVSSAIVGLVLFGDWARDQYERLALEIHPHDTVDASSLVLPFQVTNRSLFRMHNVEFTCGIDLLYFMDADRKTGILRDMTFAATGAPSIKRNKLVNYPCDASRFVQIRPDGSLIMGFPSGQSMTTKPFAFRPPLTIVKMCLWISGQYRLFGTTIHFATTMFQWPAAPGQRQWIEGPISGDDANERWIPEGSQLGGAWALRALTAPGDAGQRPLLPGALACTRAF
jgi:hypothetical protein